MTLIQICALTVACIFVGITYWLGYRNGLIDGRIEGRASSDTARNAVAEQLRHQLCEAQTSLKKSHWQRQRAQEATKLGEPERKTLLFIAEQLLLAAETFKALRAEGSARKALDSREKVLAIATLLDRSPQEQAA